MHDPTTAPEVVRAEHDRALAAGERRQLLRTADGGWHSYADDEIGFVPAGSGVVVSSAAGMVVLAAFFAIAAVLTIFLVLGPTRDGRGPMWGALLLTAGALAGAWHAARLARGEMRARRVRRLRGVPEPSPVVGL